MRLKADLWFLGGYPLLAGRAPQGPDSALPWACIPQIGSRLEPAEQRLDRQSILRATRACQVLCRDFPRALTSLTGDRERWRQRTLGLLDHLKEALHRGRPLPSGGQLLASLAPAAGPAPASRLYEQLRQRRPLLQPLSDALCWRHFCAADDRVLGDALAWCARHAAALDRIRTGTGDGWLSLAVRLTDLARLDGEARLAPLLAWLADERSYSVRFERQPQLVAELGRLLKARKQQREPDALPRLSPPPQPLLGRRLRQHCEWLFAADQPSRRGALKLLELLLPRRALDDWCAWWSEHEPRLRRLQGLLSNDHLSRAQLSEASGLHGALRQLESRAQPAESVPEVFAAIEQAAGARPQQLRAILATVPLLPELAEGRWLRYRFVGLWLSLQQDHPRCGQLLTELLSHFRSYLRRHSDCLLPSEEGQAPGALEPWAPLWHAKPRYFSVYENLFLYSDRPERRQIGIFYEALSEVFQAARQAAPSARSGWCSHQQLHLLKDLSALSPGSAEPGLSVAAVALAIRSHPKGERRRYFSPAELKAARQLSGGRAEQLAELLHLLTDDDLNGGGLPDSDAAGLELACRSPAVAALLARLALRGELRRVRRLAAGLWLLHKLGRTAELTCPAEPGAGPAAWLERYPPELHPLLQQLAAVDPRAEQTAGRVLGQRFADPARLGREIAALEERLRAPLPDPETRRRCQRRCDNLRARLAQKPRFTSEKQRSKHLAKVRQAIDRRTLESWEQQLEADLEAALGAELGHDPPLPEWLGEPRCRELLPYLWELPAPFRLLAVQLLRARCGPAPWDLRERPQNRRFVQQLERRGIDPAPWLDGLGTSSHQVAGRRIELCLEPDPLEVLHMGGHFGTCLSPGSFNFFSAVTNAVDINKRVLYARDEDGTVRGRCLLALCERGTIVTFHPYAHDSSLGFPKLAADFVAALGAAMGTGISASGRIPTLVAPSWYDDGPSDFSDSFSALKPGAPGYEWLLTVAPEAIAAELSQAKAPLQLSPITLPVVLGLAPVEQRPELALPLLRHVEAAYHEVDYDSAIRAAQLALRAGSAAAAQRLVERYIIRHAIRLARRGNADERVPELLIELGRPSLALRLLRLSRLRGVRRWADEWEGRRIYLAARAHEALRRPGLALKLYRLAAPRRPLAKDIGQRIAALQKQLSDQPS